MSLNSPKNQQNYWKVHSGVVPKPQKVFNASIHESRLKFYLKTMHL